jgi:UDP-N-acetylmuramate dehydrogenase
MNANLAGDIEIMGNTYRGRLLQQEPLAKYTSWRVGGPATQMYFPADREDLCAFLATLPAAEPIIWLGLGSNLLIRDGGIHGTVINTRGRLKQMHLIEDTLVHVEAGVPCAHVAKFCVAQGLQGAEFLAGIPGTMGGALRMNAGAFEGETWNIVESVEMINANGQVQLRLAEQFTVGYRSVEIKAAEWFLSAQLRLQQGAAEQSQEKIRQLLNKRAQTQPTNQPTCGSVFKNPPGDYAARLIESSGLKGYCVGGACVSEKHANFIVNTGQATASDIEALIEYVRDAVQRQHDILLSCEVCILGEQVS